MTPLCCLDMDGVLVDFYNGCLELFGKNHTDLKIGDESIRHFGDNLSDEEFYEQFDYDFWVNLKFTEEALDLVGFVVHLFGRKNVCIVSTPMRKPETVAAKLHWIQTHLPEFSRQNLLGAPKHFCACHRTVLVDDMKKNVVPFRENGGAAIMMPRPWNERHMLSAVSLNIVKQELEEFYEHATGQNDRQVN